MSEKKKGGKEFDNPYSVAKAVTNGNALTKLSMVVLGLGNIAHHQIIKGLGMLAIEIAFIAFMVMKGAGYIVDLVHLGDRSSRRYGVRQSRFMSIQRVIIHFLCFCLVWLHAF